MPLITEIHFGILSMLEILPPKLCLAFCNIPRWPLLWNMIARCLKFIPIAAEIFPHGRSFSWLRFGNKKSFSENFPLDASAYCYCGMRTS